MQRHRGAAPELIEQQGSVQRNIAQIETVTCYFQQGPCPARYIRSPQPVLIGVPNFSTRRGPCQPLLAPRRGPRLRGNRPAFAFVVHHRNNADVVSQDGVVHECDQFVIWRDSNIADISFRLVQDVTDGIFERVNVLFRYVPRNCEFGTIRAPVGGLDNVQHGARRSSREGHTRECPNNRIARVLEQLVWRKQDRQFTVCGNRKEDGISEAQSPAYLRVRVGSINTVLTKAESGGVNHSAAIRGEACLPELPALQDDICKSNWCRMRKITTRQHAHAGEERYP